MTKQRIKRRYGERTHTKRILAVCFTGFVLGLLVCRGGDAAFSKTVMGISATVDAAAFTAAADMMAGGGGDVASFTAGQVSVKGRTAAETAALAGSLRQAAEELMAPYTEPGDFAFLGVPG